MWKTVNSFFDDEIQSRADRRTKHQNITARDVFERTQPFLQLLNDDDIRASLQGHGYLSTAHGQRYARSRFGVPLKVP